MPHAAIAKGATLDFEMGPTPSRWGSAPDDAPPSLTAPGKRPAPLADLLGTDAHVALADGGEATALHDDDAGTVVAVSRAPTITLSGLQRGTPMLYTLTSGNAAIGASAWTLEGRKTGGAWKIVDQRSDERFAWPLQTRPFRMTTPGAYAEYRLRLKMPARAELAEIELLGD